LDYSTLSPIDLVPGFIPLAGQLDDIIVALSAILGELKRLPVEKKHAYLSKLGLTIDTIESDLAEQNPYWPIVLHAQ
jgi:uncharacterized membrane protein YkvA (DUF1232 family)